MGARSLSDGPLAEDYLRLGLRLERHVEGVIDAWFGPPELAAEVDAEPLREPQALVAAADELLGALGDSWLRDQVVGLRTYAGILAGEPRSLVDEVEGCFGVRIAHTDEAVFAAAHEQLAALLPGDGPLAERYARWEHGLRVPAEHVERAVSAVIDAARAAAGDLVRLPDGEGVAVELVQDVPWMAYCEYLGGYRSRISVNAGLPFSAYELLVLAIHETYPGHHVERACKEEVLVRGQGLLEESIVLLPTPQSLIAEGIAGLAPDLLLAGDAASALVAAVGVDFDLEHAVAVRRALEPCRWAEVNAALMLHDDGANEAVVRAYLEQWGLMTPELSAHLIRFFGDPTSRAYIATYPTGRELCGAFVAGSTERFQRLLTEQVRVIDLAA